MYESDRPTMISKHETHNNAMCHKTLRVRQTGSNVLDYHIHLFSSEQVSYNDFWK